MQYVISGCYPELYLGMPRYRIAKTVHVTFQVLRPDHRSRLPTFRGKLASLLDEVPARKLGTREAYYAVAGVPMKRNHDSGSTCAEILPV